MARRIIALGRGWLDPDTGRWFPQIAGGAEVETEETKVTEETTTEGEEGKSTKRTEVETEEKVSSDDDWKTKARKHESAAKRERKAREEAERRLKEYDDKNKSDLQKAIDEAREEGKKEALSEAEKVRRADRLEVAVTRLAAKGVSVETEENGKVKTETLRFEDPEDAQVFIERAIARGDIGEDDIFDDEGKVKTEALSEALAELLKSKPRLAAGAEGRPSGDPDTRKGNPAQKDLESMTPEDHARRKYGEQK